MVVTYVSGDAIVDYGNDPKALIVQQNNCTARKNHSGSFAWSIARLLGVDPYALRAARGDGIFPNLAKKDHREKMGDVLIFGEGNEDTARVACLFAQYRMGVSGSQYYLNSLRVDQEYKTTPDDTDTRLKTFRTCLEKLKGKILNGDNNNLNVDTIVFPERIGCDRAGGDWSKYLREIEHFAKELKLEKHDASVIICKLKK